MENITNIKYKKKYHKYKNKYYKLVQNHKLKGGSQAYSIIAVILTIIGILGLGSLLYKNNDKLKNWFDKNAELLKKRIKYFTRKEKYIQNKKRDDEEEAEEEKNLGFLGSLKSFNPFSSNNNPSKSDTSGETINSDGPQVSEVVSKDSGDIPKDSGDVPKDPIDVPKDPIVNPGVGPTNPEDDSEDSGVVPEVSMQGFIFKDPKGASILTELQTILKTIFEGYLEANPYNEEILIDDIQNNGGIWYKKDKSLDLDEVHWNIGEKHFYWSNNPNNGSDVIIKYYNRFDDKQNISVYKLTNDNVWEPLDGYKLETSNESTPEDLKPETKPQDKSSHYIFNKTINDNNKLKEYLTNIGLEFLYNNNINDDTVNEFINFMASLTDGNYVEEYNNYLNEIINNQMNKLDIELTTQEINGDGLCQFYSIIHQLQGKSEPELNELLNKYNDNDNYKSFEGKLKKNIQNFINEIIKNKADNKGNIYKGEFKNEPLANKLKEIMRDFIKEHKDKMMQYCNPQGKQEQEDKMSYKTLVEALFTNVDAFNKYYSDEKKEWGDDITLTIIAAIFNLKIILYKKQDGKYIQDIRQPLYLDKEDECNNPVEIKLLHTNITNQKQALANHYESVI